MSFALVLALCTGVEASWYWPFSSDDETKPPRVSELMEPASVMIDEAYDLADEGKTSEAVEKYRAALAELDRIEAENPDRVKEPEFNTLKNKRATVRAAIDSLLLSEAQDNARTIAVSDTTELQKKYDAKRRKATKMEERGAAKPEPESGATTEVAAELEAPAEQPKVIELPQKPKSKMAIALEDLAKRDFAAVELTVKEILEERPNDAAALNLKAAAEMAQGDAKAAEKTLDQAIHSNPRGYHAYYNMARLMAGLKGNRSGAKHYYEAGRSLGGPVDAKLEELLK